MKKITLFKDLKRDACGAFNFKTCRLTLGCFLIAFLASVSGRAQVNYNYGWEPNGLGNWVAAGAGDPFARTTVQPCTGNGSVRANAYLEQVSRLRSPNLGTSLGGVTTLTYNYKVVEFGDVTVASPAAEVSVLVQRATATGGPWVNIQTITGDSHIASADCTTASVSFIPPAGNLFLRFTVQSIGEDADVYYYIDDVTVTEGAVPTCFPPTAITASVTTETTGSVSWTAPNPAPAAGYEYYVSTSSVTPAAGATATGSTGAGVVTAALTGLTPGAVNYIWVRSVCAATDKSFWGGPVTIFTGYCIPAPSEVDGDGITNVTLGSIDNPSEAETGNYGDYTALVTDVTAGGTVNFSITFTTDGFEYGTRIWIDWNNDLDFTDAGELVYTGLSTDEEPSSILTGSFTVPSGAAVGMHRLRIGGSDNDAGVGPCFSGAYASFEDYSINVILPGAPAIASFTPAAFCAASAEIAITGTNLEGASITIGGTAVTPTSVTATEIIATVAAGISGTIVVTTAGGTASSLTMLTANVPPAITFSSPSVQICEGATSGLITITQGFAADTAYMWSPATGISGTAADGYTFNPTETTTYTLTATTSGGCVTMKSYTVTVNAAPNQVTITPASAAVCAGATQMLTLNGATAAGNAVLGTGTTAPGATTFPNPFSAYFGGVKTQILYTAAELQAQGLIPGSAISSIAFDFFASAANADNDLKIRLGSTNIEALTTNFIPSTSFTTVYSGTFIPTAGTTGMVAFNFTNNYIWDGNSIIVEIVHNQGNTGNGQGTRTRTTATAFNSVIYGAADSVTPAGSASFDGFTFADFNNIGVSGISMLRPNATFNYSLQTTATWSPATDLYTNAAATVAYTGQDTDVVYTKPTASTTYTVTVTNQGGCSITQSVNVTVTTADAPTGNAAVTLCGNRTVADLTATAMPGGTIQWYANVTGGTALAASASLVSGTTYYASQTINGCESAARLAVTVTLIPVAVDDPADVSVCDSYTLPALTNGNYFTAQNGGGTQLSAGSIITTSQTIYVFAESGLCTAEESFTVTIGSVNLTQPENVTACGSYTLPALTTGNYYTATNGGGTLLPAGTVLTTTQDIHIFAQAGPCSDSTVFTVTINNIAVDNPADITVCAGYTLPALTNGAYYTATGGAGTSLPAGMIITQTQTIYVYAQSGTVPNCTAENSFVVTVNNVLPVDAPADVTACGSYVLPVLVSGNYYTMANGLGTPLFAGDAITATQTIYVYAESGSVPNCISQQTFVVTIDNAIADDPADVIACNSYTLPALTNGNYFTAPNGSGTGMVAGTIITESQLLYVYAQSGTMGQCTAENSFMITISSGGTINGEAEQTVTAANGIDATIEDIVIIADGTVTWYATLQDATNAANPLAAGTALVSGNTYYAVQSNNNCTSEPFAVTVTVVVLGDKDFSKGFFSYYPNPVKDVLTVTYSNDIASVAVFNLLGQQVIVKDVSAAEGKIDMSNLADGTYIVNVTAGDSVKTIKVIKKQ